MKEPAGNPAGFLFEFQILHLILLTVEGGGDADVFAEYPIELGETIKSAGSRNFGDGNLCINQQRLHISYPGHLNIVCDRKAGDILELMGQIAAADTEFFCKKFQR